MLLFITIKKGGMISQGPILRARIDVDDAAAGIHCHCDYHHVFYTPLILAVGLTAEGATGVGLLTGVFGFASGRFSCSRKKLIDYKQGGMIPRVTIPPGKTTQCATDMGAALGIRNDKFYWAVVRA